MDREPFAPHIPSQAMRMSNAMQCFDIAAQREIAIAFINALLNALHIALFNVLENELALGLR